MATRTKQKAAKNAENKDKRPTAHARHIRISPYKVRIVLDLVRGKSVNEALAILAATPNASALPVTKVINSAAANAENNSGLAKDELIIAELYAGQGPTLKRMQPVSKGRGHSILKRTSHITVILDTVKEAAK